MAISGAVNREGVAYSPDGAVYVQLAPGSTIASPTFTGAASMPAGSAEAPGIYFGSDTTTGWYRQAANVWGYATSGVASFRVHSSGFYAIPSFLYGFEPSAGAGLDTALGRNGAGMVEVNTGSAGTFGGIKAATVNQAGANGQLLVVKHLTELTTIAAAANTDTTIQMPAGAVILAVSVRVTTVIPTATDFTVGDSGSAARFSTAAVSTAADSTDKGTKAGAYYNASALSVRITPNLSPVNNTGRVRVTIHYYEVTPPTS